MAVYGNFQYLGVHGTPLDKYVITLPDGVTPATEGVHYNSNYAYDSHGDTCLAILQSVKIQFKRRGKIDAFLVGGGASGIGYRNASFDPAIHLYSTYASGGNTSAFGYTANGGNPPSGNGDSGSNGGSGGGIAEKSGYSYSFAGPAGTNGGNTYLSTTGGRGQGRSTKAFEETQGVLFSGGGAGICVEYHDPEEGSSYYETVLNTHDVTAGSAVHTTTGKAGNALANRGGGGGGAAATSQLSAHAAGGGGGYTQVIKGQDILLNTQYSITIGAGGTSSATSQSGGWVSPIGGNGGSGIVLIRAHWMVPCTYTGAWDTHYSYNSNGAKCIALLGNGSLTFTKDAVIDVFCVGGGGGGGGRQSYAGAEGSDIGTAGGVTSFGSYPANGGMPGGVNSSNAIGGNGGSAGGSGMNSSYKNGGSNGASVGGATGQGNTCAFGENGGVLFAGGGGGSSRHSYTSEYPEDLWYGYGGTGAGNGYTDCETSTLNLIAKGQPNTGGGGGGCTEAWSNNYHARAGGGGGGYVQTYSNISVTAGQTIPAIIGAGGHGATRKNYGDQFGGNGGSGIILIRFHE